MLPMGSHLSLFLFYILPPTHFFWFQFTPEYLPFLTPAIFYIDGWMDGWMDGWSINFFFFDHILETTQYFFSILSVPLNICFCTSFDIFWKKKTECFFFQKISPKSRFRFFRIFFFNFSNFSKTTQYFFPIAFGPLRRDFKTSFKKFCEKKIEIFCTQKISHNLFFFAKK